VMLFFETRRHEGTERRGGGGKSRGGGVLF